MFCPNCGKENKDSAKFCMNCGAALAITNQTVIKEKKPKKLKPVIIISAILVLAVFAGALLFFKPWENKKDSSDPREEETEKYNKTNDPSHIHSEEEEEEEEKEEKPLSQVNYYDSEGNLIYYEVYSYYDNGLLCATTLYYIENSLVDTVYEDMGYSVLYLYDSEGNLSDRIIDAAYYDGEGEIILKYIYDEDHNSTEIKIDPLNERIDQEKFGVDPSKTEKIYGEPIMIPSSDSKWAQDCLEEIIANSNPNDSTECSLFYMNDDDIPEIWIDHRVGVSGAYVYTMNNGSTDTIYVYHGDIEFVERRNLIYVSGAYQGYCYDEVYKIENGKFSPIHKSNHRSEYDPEQSELQGEYVANETYHINDTIVSVEEYNQALNSAYDTSKSTKGRMITLTFNRFKQLLNTIAYPDAESSKDPVAMEAYQTVLTTAFGVLDSAYEDKQYTLYDIDKDGTEELIINDDNDYYIYSYKNGVCNRVGELFSAYPNCLYKYDENGIAVHDGGSGNMHIEYVTLYSLENGKITAKETLVNTEWDTYEKLQATLDSYKRIYDFYPVDDFCLLK